MTLWFLLQALFSVANDLGEGAQLDVPAPSRVGKAGFSSTGLLTIKAHVVTDEGTDEVTRTCSVVKTSACGYLSATHCFYSLREVWNKKRKKKELRYVFDATEIIAKFGDVKVELKHPMQFAKYNPKLVQNPTGPYGIAKDGTPKNDMSSLFSNKPNDGLEIPTVHLGKTRFDCQKSKKIDDEVICWGHTDASQMSEKVQKLLAEREESEPSSRIGKIASGKATRRFVAAKGDYECSVEVKNLNVVPGMSGGPCYVGNRLVGVVSSFHGPGKNTANAIGFFKEINPRHKWLQDNMNKAGCIQGVKNSLAIDKRRSQGKQRKRVEIPLPVPKPRSPVRQSECERAALACILKGRPPKICAEKCR